MINLWMRSAMNIRLRRVIQKNYDSLERIADKRLLSRSAITKMKKLPTNKNIPIYPTQILHLEPISRRIA